MPVSGIVAYITIKVDPALGKMQKTAGFLQAISAALDFVACQKLHLTVTVAPLPPLTGDDLETQPMLSGVKCQCLGAGRGMPGRQQIVGLTQIKCRIARPHQRLGSGRGSGCEDEGATAVSEWTLLTTGAVLVQYQIVTGDRHIVLRRVVRYGRRAIRLQGLFADGSGNAIGDQERQAVVANLPGAINSRKHPSTATAPEASIVENFIKPSDLTLVSNADVAL